MTIGEKIKHIRKEKGFTQKELGIALGGISQQQIGQWETGKANPKIETLKKIASVLNVPWNIFISDFSPTSKGEIIKTEIIEMINKFNIEVESIEKKDFINIGIEETKKRIKYIDLYDSLNRIGQNKALEHVEMLAKIPEYRKEEKTTSMSLIEEEKKENIDKKEED